MIVARTRFYAVISLLTALLGIIYVYFFSSIAIKSVLIIVNAHYVHPQLIPYVCATFGAFTVVRFAWNKFHFLLGVLDVCRLYGEKDAALYIRQSRKHQKVG